MAVKEKSAVLVVADDFAALERLRWGLQSAYEVTTAENRARALEQWRRFEPSVIVLDLSQHTEALALLEEFLLLQSRLKIIVVTLSSERAIALQAIRMGAYDFYPKPVEVDTLYWMVERAFHVYALEKEQYQATVAPTPKIDGLIYSSRVMEKVCTMVEKVSHTNATVLLLGESGSGKEVIARGIHRLSARAGGRFVAINCAAIPENLLESELFGYERGAFTGAIKQTLGKIEWANKGTLFLDEIGDLPLSLQPKLLRFLQERVIERLGGREEISLDVRVICATHQSLKAVESPNRFREDLYYRISEVAITIPPLRAREQDVIILAKAFLTRFNAELNRRIKGFSRSALEAIEAYPWPGNVRELENCIKRAVIMADGSTIRSEDLDIVLTNKQKLPFNLRKVRDHAQSEAIRRAMQYVDGNVSRAAALLGVTRPTLYHLMDKLEIREKVNAL